MLDHSAESGSPGSVTQTSPANQSLQPTRQSDWRVLPGVWLPFRFSSITHCSLGSHVGWEHVSFAAAPRWVKFCSPQTEEWLGLWARCQCRQTRWSGPLRLTAGVLGPLLAGWEPADRQSLASSCLSSPKWSLHLSAHFTARAVSAQSRALGAADGGVCRAYHCPVYKQSHALGVQWEDRFENW